jgi:hypothetical protein
VVAKNSFCEAFPEGDGLKGPAPSIPCRPWRPRLTGRATGATLAEMLTVLEAALGALLAALRPRASLVAENLLLRQQLAILRRTHPRPRLRAIDRTFWVVVSRVWSRWADTLAIVQPGYSPSHSFARARVRTLASTFDT